MTRRASVVMRRRVEAGFTLVELLAAVALLIILMTVLFVVFSEASQTVSIGKARMEMYRTVRAVFRVLEEDITSAFLISEGSNTYGFIGEDGTDPAVLSPAPDGHSDRLTLIRPRRNYTPGNPKPGFVEVCYLRVGGLVSMPGRPNLLLRAMDEEEAGKPGSRLSSSSWEVGEDLPLDFPLPDQGDAVYPDFFQERIADGGHAEHFEHYLLALDVTDLQFDYLEAGTDTWTGDGDWDCDDDGLPAAVRVTLRVGPADSTDPNDHETFTHTVFLPTAP